MHFLEHEAPASHTCSMCYVLGFTSCCGFGLLGQCYVVRNKSGKNMFHPKYTVYLQDGDRQILSGKVHSWRGLLCCVRVCCVLSVVLSCVVLCRPVLSCVVPINNTPSFCCLTDSSLSLSQKRMGNKTSNYLMSVDDNPTDRKSDNIVGKLRANFVRGVEGPITQYPTQLGQRHNIVRC